jgi:hypothetical protein
MAGIHPLSPGFEDQVFRRRISAAAGLNTATYLFIEITSCLRMIYAITIEGKITRSFNCRAATSIFLPSRRINYKK